MNLKNCSFTGLKNYKRERELIKKDIKILQALVKDTCGHLGDVVSSLRTTQASLELKAKFFSEEFRRQKEVLPED